MSDFVHLHTHSEYSMLDGISHLADLAQRAAALEMPALALTDHGNLHGAVDFYQECRKVGVKPILGCEVYVARESRQLRPPDERSPHHLVLLARNNTGYGNLMRLVTAGHLEGFHHRPRIDFDLLQEHQEGLICLSGCASAQVPRLLKDGQYEAARAVADQYRSAFGPNYYLELQRHAHVPGLDDINAGLVRLSADLNIELVVTNDSHYTNQDQHQAQDIYICIQTGTTQQDEQRLRMEDNSYYLKTAAEMQELFDDFPAACRNTARIAESCELELDFNQVRIPSFPLPAELTADQYLRQLCESGFAERYPGEPPAARARLEYELQVIAHTNFANYFLVVWDIARFARRERILMAVRGSAAASVALHCLGITDVEPLGYQLVFERFLNYERKEMPDIDMDFPDHQRERVLDYVIQRYGAEHVAHIANFTTLGPRGVIKDVGRALSVSYDDTARLARLVPAKAKTLTAARAANPEFDRQVSGKPALGVLLEQAQRLEGTVRHVGTHAAGVLISEQPLVETVPLQRPVKQQGSADRHRINMTQFSMDPVAKLGLLKMDFLGLTSLTIIGNALQNIQDSRGLEIDLVALQLDDPDTFQMLATGKTTDVFQLESAGMQRYIQELQPTTLTDISAMIALYRPGPMDQIDKFIESRHGRAPITYPHDSLKELLDETYGVIVYQDQVLLLLQQFAGYSLGEADTVRKAMGKKDPKLMAAERQRFIEGAIGQEFSQEISAEIWDLIEPFAGYAFNKAHSISYARISYWTAFLKTHFPREYTAAVLDSRFDNAERLLASVNEASRLGLELQGPDLNRSASSFSLEKDDALRVRFGISNVKNVGPAVARLLLEPRDRSGPYAGPSDLARRVDLGAVNKNALESLTKAGALDFLGPRPAVLAALQPLIDASKKLHQSGGESENQARLFATPEPAQADLHIDQELPANPEQAAHWEQELLGISLSADPLQPLRLVGPELGCTTMEQLEQAEEQEPEPELSLVARLKSAKTRQTRDQRRFIVLSMELLDGGVEAVAWSDLLEQLEPGQEERLLVAGNFLRCQGKLKQRGEGWSLNLADLTLYDAAPRRDTVDGDATPDEYLEPADRGTVRPCRLEIRASADPTGDARRLRRGLAAALKRRGSDPVKLAVLESGRRVILELPHLKTKYSAELARELREFEMELEPELATP